MTKKKPPAPPPKSWAAGLAAHLGSIEASRPKQVADPEPVDPDAELLALWTTDTAAFARCFDIADKDLDIAPFEPSQLQLDVWEWIDLHKRSQFLKGRQIWCTTAVAVYVLKLCLLRPGFRACLAAHDDKASMQIGKFYDKLYKGNAYLVEKNPRIDKGAHLITFQNGSQILIGTANSAFWQGQPANFAHLTEAAKYDDLGTVISDLGQCVPPSGWICMESTARGDNAFRAYWNSKRTTFARKFLCWMDHPEYVDFGEMPADLIDIEIEHIKKHRLPKERAVWWVKKYREQDADKQHLIDENYPCRPEDAFKVSGDKYLRKQVPEPAEVPVMQYGISRILTYHPTHQYAAGVDTASGSETGDESAVVILDLTMRAVAATMAYRLPGPEFSSVARELLREYHDPLTVVETNTFGLEVCVSLREAGVPQFMMTANRGLAVTVQQTHGWMTDPATRPILFGGLFNALNGMNRWLVGCLRLVKQCNNLVYDKHGKPKAPSGQHDDLAVAFALAVQGCSQAHEPEVKPGMVQRIMTAAETEWARLVSGAWKPWAGRNGSTPKPQRGDFPDS